MRELEKRVIEIMDDYVLAVDAKEDPSVVPSVVDDMMSLIRDAQAKAWGEGVKITIALFDQALMLQKLPNTVINKLNQINPVNPYREMK